MKNKIEVIKKAIMDVFPNAESVFIILDDDFMNITIKPLKTSTEDEFEHILIEGRTPWKSMD